MKSVITVPVRGSIDFNRNAPVIVPNAPNLLSVTAGNGQNSLTWSPSPSAVSYTVYFQTTPGVTTASTSIVLGDVTNFTHSGLVNGTTYYYKVQAIGSGGGESALSNELSGTPTAATFSNQFSLELNGINQYAVLPQSKTGDFAVNAGQTWTLSMWVKVQTTGNQVLWDAMSNINNGGLQVRLTGTNQVQLTYNGPLLGSVEKTSILSLDMNWNHIVIKKENGPSAVDRYFIYINGALVATTDNGGTALGNHGTLNTNLIIGALGTDTASNEFFDGFLDEISWFNTDLSELEIEELYNAGTPDDLLNHSSVANLVSWWRMGDGDGVIIFDQVNNNDLAIINSPLYSTDVP